MADNVFNENEEYLIEARNEVLLRDELAADIAKMKNQRKRLEKNIASEEKSIADEITSTIKKRKQEIEGTYDERLDDNRSKKKMVSNKRDKKKIQRISQRIDEETKYIRENTRDLEVEMRTVLKKDKTPLLCKKSLYFIMFAPKGIGEYLLSLLAFLIYFVGIPAFITFLFKCFVLNKRKNINMSSWCIAIMAIIIIVFLILYFLIYNLTKNKHRNAINNARTIRDKIKANKKQMAAIRNSINKDKDESLYNLTAYDDKLKKLDKEADSIGEEKQDALRIFEKETRQLIIDEINGRRLQNLDDMKADKRNLDKNISQREKEYSDQILLITKKYASYLGEDMCKEEKLADLIALIEEEQANTVSEAIALYKNQ